MSHRPSPGRLAVAALLVLSLVGCGEDSGGDADPGSASTDPCELLTDAEIAAYVGEGDVTKQATDDGDRPRCEWTGQGAGTVSVLLWEPPFPDTITGQRSVPVGDSKGYVVTETSASCHMNVDAGEGEFVQLDVFATGLQGPDRGFCAGMAAETGAAILDRLG
jgi:hypothetical protein